MDMDEKNTLVHAEGERPEDYYIWSADSGPEIDELVRQFVLLPLVGLEAFVAKFGADKLSPDTLQHIEDRQAGRVQMKAGRDSKPFFERWAQLREAKILFDALRLGIRDTLYGDGTFDIREHVEVWEEDRAVELLEKALKMEGSPTEIAAELVKDEKFSGESINEPRVLNLIAAYNSDAFVENHAKGRRFKPKNN
jgi:hypothetical protein